MAMADETQKPHDEMDRCPVGGKRAEQAQHLISFLSLRSICDWCIGRCNRILAERRHQVPKRPRKRRPRLSWTQRRVRADKVAGTERAAAMVHGQYECILDPHANLSLARMNKHRHPTDRYCSMDEYVREMW